MRRILLFALALSQLFSCKSEDTPLPPEQDLDALYQQFHGRYKIVSAVASEALDVNFDGNPSTNLLAEIDELRTGAQTEFYSQVNIPRSFNATPKPSFLFIQNWPEQFLRLEQGKVWDGIAIIPFNKDYTFDFDMKVLVREFSFSEDLKQLIVIPDDSEDPVFKLSAPKSVTVLNDGKLVVIATRRLYTSDGVKEVIVTTTYERFTMAT
ncbi:hypothetical protein [Dyadobacter arcticus]|uniref:DUF4840 domain-containing protein n=1 Tax=Dyadobacter arcticus TaxID=1078754 RepID=A0ABX0UNC6_9BACT|nr:hypothetical protein [Dyadobacter arcticus]NIJ54488.1 hypothetical protein [Dyadobacter arcticus]